MKYYNIEFDGNDGYDCWNDYPVSDDEDMYTEKDMLEDVRQGLKELGGGHADIWDTDTDELFAEIEV